MVSKQKHETLTKEIASWDVLMKIYCNNQFRSIFLKHEAFWRKASHEKHEKHRKESKWSRDGDVTLDSWGKGHCFARWTGEGVAKGRWWWCNGAIFGMFVRYFLRIYWRLLRRLSFHQVLLGGKGWQQTLIQRPYCLLLQLHQREKTRLVCAWFCQYFLARACTLCTLVSTEMEHRTLKQIFSPERVRDDVCKNLQYCHCFDFLSEITPFQATLITVYGWVAGYCKFWDILIWVSYDIHIFLGLFLKFGYFHFLFQGMGLTNEAHCLKDSPICTAVRCSTVQQSRPAHAACAWKYEASQWVIPKKTPNSQYDDFLLI